MLASANYPHDRVVNYAQKRDAADIPNLTFSRLYAMLCFMYSDWELVHSEAHRFSSTLLKENKAKLILTDPPFGTGKMQKLGTSAYMDREEHDLVINGLKSSIVRHLDDEGTVAVICDYRLAYDIVPELVTIGLVLRGEIIWEFGLGRPRSTWWPNRHNHILTFTWSEKSGLFDASAIPRDRRLAPKAGYPEDKPAGSVWQYTMSNTDPQRVEYPNQKSIELLSPFVLAHTNPNDVVLDPFCGSSSVGIAALMNDRRFVGVDANYTAIEVSSKRIMNQIFS